jgi:hypothetical protein
MIGKLNDVIGANPPKESVALLKLISIFMDEPAYLQLVEDKLSSTPGYDNRKDLYQLGHFSGQDFMDLIHETGDGTGTYLHVASALLDRLIEWGLVGDVHKFLPTAFSRYQWNKGLIAEFASYGVLDNALFGPAYTAEKYRRSVPAIFVEKDGDQHTGTGFLATNRGGRTERVVVTARHNVDPSTGITFSGFNAPGGANYAPMAEGWILHPTLDVAIMPVTCDHPTTPIFPVGNAQILARTITLGYPRIATTDGPYLLANGGELNAIVQTYYGEQRLIISNTVAPGNSGGPVLDEAGLCVGMVVSSLETTHEGGRSVVNAAIPASAILEFISTHLA